MRPLASALLLALGLTGCDAFRYRDSDGLTNRITFVEGGGAVLNVDVRPTWQTGCGDEGCSTVLPLTPWYGEGPRPALNAFAELPPHPTGRLRVVYPRRAGLGGPPEGAAYVIVESGGRAFYSRSGTLTVRRRGSVLEGHLSATLADTTGLAATLAGTFSAGPAD